MKQHKISNYYQGYPLENTEMRRPNPAAVPITNAIIDKTTRERAQELVATSKEVANASYKYVIRPCLVTTGMFVAGTVIFLACIIQSILTDARRGLQQGPPKGWLPKKPITKDNDQLNVEVNVNVTVNGKRA